MTFLHLFEAVLTSIDYIPPEAQQFRGRSLARRDHSSTRSRSPILRDSPASHPNTGRRVNRHRKELLPSADQKTEACLENLSRAHSIVDKALTSNQLGPSRGFEAAKVADFNSAVSPSPENLLMNAPAAQIPSWVPLTRDDLTIQDGAFTRDEPRVERTFGLYDLETPDEADLYNSSYGAAPGIPFAGHPNDGVSSNAYTMPVTRMQRVTRPLAFVPSNAYIDADGNLARIPSPDNAHIDRWMWESHANFGQQNQIGSIEMLTDLQQNLLMEEQFPASHATKSFDVEAEYTKLMGPYEQGEIGAPNGFSNSPYIPIDPRLEPSPVITPDVTTPAWTYPSVMHTQREVRASSGRMMHPFLKAQAVHDQRPLYGSIIRANHIHNDPFANFSKEAILAHLASPDIHVREPSFDAHARGDHPRHTSTRPSVPASQARIPNGQRAGRPDASSTTPITAALGAYPHHSSTRRRQNDVQLSWWLYNRSQVPPYGEDHFFPGFVDSLDSQVWFPKRPGHIEPWFKYKHTGANYYFNVGIKACNESNLTRGGTSGTTGRPLLPERPTSNLPANLTPRPRHATPQRQIARTNPGKAGRTAMGPPTRDFVIAADAPAGRTAAAGTRRPTEACQVAGTPALGNPVIRRPRGLRPHDSGTIGAPISITNWIEENVPAGLEPSVHPKIVNPAKKSKAPGLLVKPSIPKRQGRRPAPAPGPDDEVLEMQATRRKTQSTPSTNLNEKARKMLPVRRKIRPTAAINPEHGVVEKVSTRRKARRATSFESDGDHYVPKAIKRSRTSGGPLSTIRSEDILGRVDSDLGSLADADGDNESLTARYSQGFRASPGSDGDNAA
ncbi:hypothetical protein MMC34_000702 [Xylographa carneopallida]|nr:hypothetical protein [Xylographa carneopallida]